MPPCESRSVSSIALQFFLPGAHFGWSHWGPAAHEPGMGGRVQPQESSLLAVWLLVIPFPCLSPSFPSLFYEKKNKPTKSESKP